MYVQDQRETQPTRINEAAVVGVAPGKSKIAIITKVITSRHAWIPRQLSQQECARVESGFTASL